VFYGSADGWFKALDARTGRELWKHRIGSAKRAEPVSYLGRDGHQYVAMLSAYGDSPGTLHAFSLPC
jgi:glucose dehydrogenase